METPPSLLESAPPQEVPAASPEIQRGFFSNLGARADAAMGRLKDRWTFFTNPDNSPTLEASRAGAERVKQAMENVENVRRAALQAGEQFLLERVRSAGRAVGHVQSWAESRSMASNGDAVEPQLSEGMAPEQPLIQEQIPTGSFESWVQARDIAESPEFTEHFNRIQEVVERNSLSSDDMHELLMASDVVADHSMIPQVLHIKQHPLVAQLIADLASVGGDNGAKGAVFNRNLSRISAQAA